MRALPPKLLPDRLPPRPNQRPVPRRGSINARGERRHEVREAHPEGRVLEAEPGPGPDGGDVADAAAAHPPDAGGDVDFLLEREGGDELARFGVRGGPGGAEVGDELGAGRGRGGGRGGGEDAGDGRGGGDGEGGEGVGGDRERDQGWRGEDGR